MWNSCSAYSALSKKWKLKTQIDWNSQSDLNTEEENAELNHVLKLKVHKSNSINFNRLYWRNTSVGDLTSAGYVQPSCSQESHII